MPTKTKDRPKVFICSPYGKPEKHRIRANIYCQMAYARGYLPVSPQYVFSQYLSDKVLSEREDILRFGLELLKLFDEIWVFGVNITSAMSLEIKRAVRLGKTVKFFDGDMTELPRKSWPANLCTIVQAAQSLITKKEVTSQCAN